MTPEECSAEILRVLFGYLPPEIANDPETATVITVPAAFNQMKKDATLEAARLAGIDPVTLMQEPVAAVMSVMKASPGEKRFLIYDLGILVPVRLIELLIPAARNRVCSSSFCWLATSAASRTSNSDSCCASRLC